MGALEHLGTRKPFRQFRVVTGLSYSVHKNFTKKFIECISSNKEEWISFPDTVEGIKQIMDDYERQLLPGCVGSIDVVHCKWSACPAGDKVRAKGKEKFPTVAFEVVTNNNREILGVASPQFGTRNDGDVFMTCCCLHNMMLEFADVTSKIDRVGRGAPLHGDAIYLEGPANAQRRRTRDIVNTAWLRRKEVAEAREWLKRREVLANHHYYMKKVITRT